MSRRQYKGKPAVQLITWRKGVRGYQARMYGKCYPGTTKYYACLKHGIRQSRVLAYQWLGEMLHEQRLRKAIRKRQREDRRTGRPR